MENKNIEEKERVLFTFAGGTDPTRSCHDGPILHICRYYKPKKIYLVLTKEMAERDEEPYNIYERAIKLNLKNYNPEIIRVNTNIKEAHLFESYFEVINETFDRIKKENKDVEVLVNLTSGTPQMTANLITYIVDSDMNLKGIQVPTPEKGQNKEKVVENEKKYDVELEAETNIDNESPTKRIIIPDLKKYSRVLIRNQIQELLKRYDYNAIFELLKRNVFEKSTELNTLVNFAIDRKNLKGLEVNRKLQFLNDKKYHNIFYYTKDKNIKRISVKEWYEIVDYFALANIKQKSEDIAGYILMLEPLTVKIYLSILKDIMNKELSSFFKKNKSEDYLVDVELFSEDLKKFIQRDSGVYLQKNVKGYVSDKVLSSIIKYIILNEPEKSNLIKLEYFVNLSDTLAKVKPIRNLLAHTLKNLNKGIFEKDAGTSIEYINNKITDFFKKYYTELGYKEDMIKVYDIINAYINEILESEK